MIPLPPTAVLWQRVVSIDEAILRRVRRLESDSMTRFMRALTRLGDTGSWVVVGLALASVGGARYFWLLALGAGFSVAASQLLKRLCCRPRPTSGIAGFAALAEIPDAFSFPSGHTAAAYGVAVALLGERPSLGLLALLLAAGIAISRIYLGAHYPLDVAAGMLLGVGCGAAARLLVAGLHQAALLGYASSALLFCFGG